MGVCAKAQPRLLRIKHSETEDYPGKARTAFFVAAIVYLVKVRRTLLSESFISILRESGPKNKKNCSTFI